MQKWSRSRGDGVQPSARDGDNRAHTSAIVVNISLNSGSTTCQQQSPCGRSLYIIWLEQLPQANVAEMWGLFFPSYGKSVKGTGQDCGSPLPAGWCFLDFLEVSFTSGGGVYSKMDRGKIESHAMDNLRRTYRKNVSNLLMINFIILRNKEYSKRVNLIKGDPISFLTKEPGMERRNHKTYVAISV